MRPTRVARLTNAGARLRGLSAGFSRLHARVNRATGGRLGPRWFGAPVLVLETIGRRSGKRRATPLIYVRPGGDSGAGALVVLAANAGSDRPPAWWLNLRDAGAGTVVLGGRRQAVHPRVLGGEERAAAWEAFLAVYPAAEEYLRFTQRELPLIALEPT
jgi:deazaflavin-dependent oxidoreductase (nitroreductase family)